jgi:hypothetical protein
VRVVTLSACHDGALLPQYQCANDDRRARRGQSASKNDSKAEQVEKLVNDTRLSTLTHRDRTIRVALLGARRNETMSEQNPADAPCAVASTSGPPAVDLGTLFRRDASAADRAQALQAFGVTVRARLQDVTAAAGSGAEVVAERSGQLLSELVDRLPIRRAEDLRREFGTDAQLSAEHVIGDAATLARWLWTAAKAIPAPEMIVHAAKVVLHSAIEIRMVGELLEAYRDADVEDPVTPMSAILAAWVGGVPAGRPVGSKSSVVAVLIAQTRRALKDLRGTDGRIKGIMNRGREGGDIVRNLGEKMNGALRQRAIP